MGSWSLQPSVHWRHKGDLDRELQGESNELVRIARLLSPRLGFVAVVLSAPTKNGRMTQMTIAYIDPGAGSLLIQAVIAGALAVPFLLRTKISGIWRRWRDR